MNITSQLGVNETGNSSRLIEIIEGENVPRTDSCAFKVPLENSRPIAERLFRDTLFKNDVPKHFDLNLNKAGTYFSITTDSSYHQRGQELYNQIIEPHLRERGYNDDYIFRLMHCIDEAYVNALVFGNKAGKDAEYTTRGKKIPANRDANKSKNICLEVLATDQVVVVKITDSGEGIDEKTYLEKTKGYRIHSNPEKDSPEEIVQRLLNNNGRGIYHIESYTGNIPTFTINEKGFSLSFVYRKGQEILVH